MTDDSSVYSSDSDTTSLDSQEDFDTYKAQYVEENDDITFFKDLVPDTIDGLETMVFSTTDLAALKEKEANLRSKQEGKYFRCKLTTPKLYGQINTALAPYLTIAKLIMLCHMWSTQLNEAMNNSVAAFAPKTKNFSGTLSLSELELRLLRESWYSGTKSFGHKSWMSWALKWTLSSDLHSNLEIERKTRSESDKKVK